MRDFTEADENLWVFRLAFQTFLQMVLCLCEFLMLYVILSKIKLPFHILWLQFYCLFKFFHTLLILIKHEITISNVVLSWIVIRINVKCCLEAVQGFLKFRLDAKDICKVVMTFPVVGIQLKGLLIMIYRHVHILLVVVAVAQFVVGVPCGLGLYHLLKPENCFIEVVLLDVTISQPSLGFSVILINLKCLLKISNRLLIILRLVCHQSDCCQCIPGLSIVIVESQ